MGKKNRAVKVKKIKEKKKITRKDVGNFLLRYVFITLGAICYGVGTSCFVKSAQIASGGITGFANTIDVIFPIPVGTVVALANVPLIIISFIKFKPRFAFSTLAGILLSSAAIDLIAWLLGPALPFTENKLLAAITGGILNGIGIGLIMRNGSSTGGTDIIVKLIHRKKKHLKGGVINIILGLIVCLFYLVVTRDVEGMLYSAIVIAVDGFTFDLVLYGTGDSKTVYIITDKSDVLVKSIFERIDVGATILEGKGAYTNDSKKIVLCVIKNNAFPILKDVVKDTDDNAFMIVTKSSEIFGEGYSNLEKEVL